MKHVLLAFLLITPVASCATTPQSNHRMMAEAPSMAPNNIIRLSQYDFATTDRKLGEALAKRDLKIFTVVNHGQGAKSVGMDIGQSKLYIFGNPKSGTPLMQANSQMGLELPMKILIHEDADGVHIGHTDIKSMAASYGITNQAELLSKISATLHDIISEAGG